MGTNAIASISSGYLADERYWNQYKEALCEDLYPRNSGGFIENEVSDIGISSSRFIECNVYNLITKKTLSSARIIDVSDYDITDGKIFNISGNIGSDFNFSVTCSARPFVISFSASSAGAATISLTLNSNSLHQATATTAADTAGKGLVFSLPAGTYTFNAGFFGSGTFDIKVFELL